MDVQITRSNEFWQYDPIVDEYTSGDLLKTISGAPAISGSVLRINSAEVASLNTFKNGASEFDLIIPTAPAAGDDKEFGLKLVAGGNRGKYMFDITDAVFSAKIYDETGTLISSKTITWATAWTAASAIYAIKFSESNVFFTVNGTVVAKFENGHEIIASTSLSKLPLAVYVDNNDADNVDIKSISVL